MLSTVFLCHLGTAHRPSTVKKTNSLVGHCHGLIEGVYKPSAVAGQIVTALVIKILSQMETLWRFAQNPAP